MTSIQCPVCGQPIGGTNYTLAAGNVAQINKLVATFCSILFFSVAVHTHWEIVLFVVLRSVEQAINCWILIHKCRFISRFSYLWFFNLILPASSLVCGYLWLVLLMLCSFLWLWLKRVTPMGKYQTNNK